MDRGNRSARQGYSVVFTEIPEELRYLVVAYQNTRRIPSLKATLKELLETHPALTQIAERLYTETGTSPPT